MTENNEHNIVAEAQKIINDYIDTIEGIYLKTQKRKSKRAIACVLALCIIAAIAVTFIKI